MWKLKLYFALIAISLYLFSCREIEGDMDQELKKRYYEDPETECFDNDGTRLPVYWCSGLIIRATAVKYHYPDPKKFFWSHYGDSVSVAFLRNDSRFSILGFEENASGMIFYPLKETPRGMTRLNARCAFSMNAETLDRGTNHKCTSNHCETSKFCHELTSPINTFEDWQKHHAHLLPKLSEYEYTVCQCAFDMTRENAATTFDITLKARPIILEDYYVKDDRNAIAYRESSNEILVEPWDTRSIETIPIQTLYYRSDKTSPSLGINQAFYNQADYYEHTGIILPIVKIDFSTLNGEINIERELRKNEFLFETARYKRKKKQERIEEQRKAEEMQRQAIEARKISKRFKKAIENVKSAGVKVIHSVRGRLRVHN